MRLDQIQLLPCPLKGEDVAKLPDDELRAINLQNQLIAKLQFEKYQAIRRTLQEHHRNEDRVAYFFKIRRDILLEVVGDRCEYSWRKRDIAANELSLMGYDIMEMADVHGS